ncbi:hypothetical protein TRVL_08830 [Trypanosoma vivax]|nr:hypothetical protein TRVL_08830 [Trypanosoma vivax]
MLVVRQHFIHLTRTKVLTRFPLQKAVVVSGSFKRSYLCSGTAQLRNGPQRFTEPKVAAAKPLSVVFFFCTPKRRSQSPAWTSRVCLLFPFQKLVGKKAV